MRITFLGDSLTWGGYGGDFVAVVEERMPQHEIINAGVGGDTVVNLMRRVDDVLDETQPDVMFVMVGGNDATSYHMPKTRGYYKKTKQLDDGCVTPDEFKITYRDLLQTIQLAFVQPLVGLAPTEYSRELIQYKRGYHTIARDIAKSLKVPVLDLDLPFTPHNPIDREPVDIGFIQQIGTNVSRGWTDYEQMRRQYGYTFTFDGMHLLPESAVEFAGMLVPFLHKHVS